MFYPRGCAATPEGFTGDIDHAGRVAVAFLARGEVVEALGALLAHPAAEAGPAGALAGALVAHDAEGSPTMALAI